MVDDKADQFEDFRERGRTDGTKPVRQYKDSVGFQSEKCKIPISGFFLRGRSGSGCAGLDLVCGIQGFQDVLDTGSRPA